MRVVLIGQRKQSLLAQLFHAVLQFAAAVCQHDGVVDVVHRQLCHAALHGLAVSVGQRVGNLLQVHDDLHCVVQTAVGAGTILLVDGRRATLPVVVGFGVGGVDLLGPDDELCREVLVLAVVDAGLEAQLPQHGAVEQAAADGSMQVAGAHQVGTAHGLHGFRLCSRFRSRCLLMGEVEHHHLGVGILADDVEALSVGIQQTVVAVNKLDVISLRHVQRRIACHADSAVLLPHIDDAVAIVQQPVHRTGVGTIVNNDNLALVGLHGQRQDAVDTFA